MALYDNIDNSIKLKKQKLNKSHIRNLKIMNVLNFLVMALLIFIDVFLLIKGIYTGMPIASTVLLVIFLVAQVGSLLTFTIKRFARASMITKVGIMIICFLPIIPYIIYLSIGNNIYIICLIARIICLVSLAMLLFNTKITDDKKTFGVKGVPLAIASLITFVALIVVITSTNNRKIIYTYDKLYNGYVLNNVLKGKGDVIIKDDTIAISDNSLVNVSGALVIPSSVKYISKDAFLDSNVKEVYIDSLDIELMDAINNSNVEVIYLNNANTKLDLENLNKDIRIKTDRTLVDEYRSANRKYDYLFVPIVGEDEYYVCFNGTNLPVYIFKDEELLEEPSSDSLEKEIDGRKILYDGYNIGNLDITFPITVSKNTEINCNYSYIYNINYDYSGASFNDDLPEVYYDDLGTIKLPELEKDGYQFKGWYLVDEYGNYTKEYTEINPDITTDLNLKAKFLKEYSITFDTILDDVAFDSDKTLIYTEEDVIEFVEPKKEGFSFEGWYLDPYFSNKASQSLNGEFDTLYAKWVIDEPNIIISDDLNKIYDNESYYVDLSISNVISNASYSYEFYNSNNEIIVTDEGFNVKNVVDSDSYYAIITLNYNNLVETKYRTKDINISISKASYDMSNISIKDLVNTYDGNMHTPSLVGELPIGLDNIQITYEFEEGLTNVGQKVVACNFYTLSNNYNVPESMNGLITINARDVEVTWSKILTFEYDGNLQFPSYTLKNVLQKDLDYVACEEEGSANSIGNHTASIKSLKGKNDNNYIYKNYKLLENQVIYSITAKTNELTDIEFGDLEFEYDGNKHEPEFTFIPDNVEAIFKCDKDIINVGTYDVLVSFKYKDKPNEIISTTYNVCVIINPKEVDISWSFSETTYSGNIEVPTYTISIEGLELVYDYSNSVNAGTYTITYLSLKNNDLNNYKLPENKTYQYKINPKKITFDTSELGYTDASYEYNGSNQYPTISKDKLPTNVTVSYSGFGKNAGSYKVVAEFNPDSLNYVIDDANKSITINVTITKRVAVIQWSQTTFEYDGSLKKPTATVTNLVLNDICFVYIDGDGESAVGDHTATAIGLSNTNYTLGSDNVETTYSIVAKDYNFEFIFEDVTYTYDGDYHRPEVQFLDDKPDWLNVKYDKVGICNVGSLVVTVSFEATDDSYNVPTSRTAIVTITPRTASFVFSFENTPIYNGKAIAPNVSITNLVSGDDAEVVLTDYSNNINAGTYTVYVNSISNTNYTFDLDNSKYTYEIKKADYDYSNIKFESVYTFEYNGYQQRPSLKTSDGDAVEIMGLDGPVIIEYSDGIKDVGQGRVTATFKGSDNYNQIPEMSTIVIITAKTISLKWAGDNFTYNGLQQKPSCTADGLLLTDICTVNVSGSGINAGEYTAKAVSLSNPNYKLPSNNEHPFTIEKATLDISKVSFEENTKVYDGTDLKPIVVGEIPSAATYSFIGLSSQVGTHLITVRFEVDSNYNSIPDITVEVTITKRELTVKWLDLEVEYNGQLQGPKYELTGLVSGDDCELTINGGGINVGEYTIEVIGISNNNYSLTIPDDVTYKITKANYDMSSVSFEDLTIEYNGQLQHPVISGQLPQGVSVDEYTGGATNVIDGTVTVTVSFKTIDENYNVPKSMQATITIVAKELTVTWANTTFTYDNTKHYPIAKLNGLLNDDECTFEVGGYAIDAGTYTAYIASISNSNYKASSTVSYTIKKADYDMSSVTFEDVVFNYDSTSHHQTVSGLDLVEGLDGLKLSVKYTGQVTNVIDGKVLCTATFETTSNNYNVPSDMTCYISVSPIEVNINISLDTDEDVTATVTWDKKYYLGCNYDGLAHNVNINVASSDLSNIIDGDDVNFYIDGTFESYKENGYSFEIMSSNANYKSIYDTLSVTVSKIYVGYGFAWNSIEPSWWGDYPESVLAKLDKVYTDNDLDVEVVNNVPTSYGHYYIKFTTTEESIIMQSSSSSSNTYDVSLTLESLKALAAYYTTDMGIIENPVWYNNVYELYNQLGVSDDSIEFLLNDSYDYIINSALFIDFTQNDTSSSELCTVDGNINNQVTTTKSYLNHEFSKVLKIESSTTITIDLSNTTYTTLILVGYLTNSYYNRISINDEIYEIPSSGILELSGLSGVITIEKSSRYSISGLYGIVLI